MKHDILIKVNIPFNESEPKFCGEDCHFLVRGDLDDYCRLFNVILEDKFGFNLRCKKCLKQTETKLEKS